MCLGYYEMELMELVAAAPAVVCCRCSPEQKAAVVRLIERHTGKVAAAVGDGGNDVSMIQAASVGIGIVGKEGMQASLASDFSMTQFSHIGRLLLVHGRNSYKRSASLSQFVIHRGLVITTMQASAPKSSIRRFVITEKAPTRAFSWLKAATTAFTFKTLLRHYAKRALTPRSLNVKLGPQRNYHKGRAAIRHYANQTARPL